MLKPFSCTVSNVPQAPLQQGTPPPTPPPQNTVHHNATGLDAAVQLLKAEVGTMIH